MGPQRDPLGSTWRPVRGSGGGRSRHQMHFVSSYAQNSRTIDFSRKNKVPCGSGLADSFFFKEQNSKIVPFKKTSPLVRNLLERYFSYGKQYFGCFGHCSIQNAFVVVNVRHQVP